MSAQLTNQFFWRHQPLKTIYLAYALASIAVRLPFWFVLALVPSLRPRASWTVGRTVLVHAARVLFGAIFNTGSFELVRVDPQRFAKNPDAVGLVWMDATPDLIQGDVKKYAQLNKVSAVHVPAYWYGERDPITKRVGQRAQPDEKVILAFHSGGWVMGDASPGGASAPMMRDMLSHYPQFSRLLNVEFRLASGAPWRSENPFPAALIDAIAAYSYLVNDLGFRAANVLVIGESAGGTLGLQLVRYTAEAGLAQLPPPGGLLMLSPSMDWGKTFPSGPGSSWVRNADSDWVQAFTAGYASKALLGELPGSEAQVNSWISPASTQLEGFEGMFKGLPPTLTLAGGGEMTNDAMRLAHERIKADVGEEKATFIEIPDATHIFLNLPFHEREKEDAYQKMAPWIKAHF
ncbi:alpha/beta hydrolase [Phanerochaete sordida]|uniref:Alpha/beta hydrolase n=1 Tax=Phanerochaete sordida TaxID=48140 RepID=A0A9P3G0G3_9APHY|nr:alpha/beta hydrolase [Phanerochaete sordida]